MPFFMRKKLQQQLLKLGVIALLLFAAPVQKSFAQTQVVYTGSFSSSTGGSASYSANKQITLATNTWLASYSYFASGEFRLGSNNTVSVPSKFFTSGDGSAIEMQWDVVNVKKISFTNAGQYGTVSNWYVFESTNSGTTWSQVASSSYSNNTTISYTATTPAASARYALVVLGSKPRAILTTVQIETPSGPTVTTGLPYPITATSATLKGTITPISGSAVTPSFQYGTTTSYGSTATSVSPVTTTTSATSQAITGVASPLTPNTQYSFRLNGTVGSTTTNGSNATFYTLANAPLAPVITNTTTTSLTVALNGSSDGNPSGQTYAIKVLNASGTTLGYIPLAGGALSTSAVYQTATAWGTGKTVTGLTANTTYTLLAVATNGSNVTTDGASATGTTSSCEAPTAQAAFTTANITNTHSAITLPFTPGNGSGRVVIINTTNSFTSPADGSVPSAATAYSGSGQQVVYAATTTSSASVTVTGLNPATTYYFAVFEFGCAGILYNTTPATTSRTTCSQPVIGTQPSGQTVYQPATATFTAAATGSGTVTYQWQRSTNSGSSWSNITDATSATYTTPATTVASYSGNQFRVIVTNTYGTGSTATATSSAVILTVVSPEIALTGNSVAIASGTTATATTNNTLFASYDLPTGQTATKTFTITNTGTGILNISNINVSAATGTAFVITGFTNGTVAANGGSQTFTVSFNAAAAGTYTETVTITNDDLDESAYTFVVKASAAPAGPQMAITGNSTAVADGGVSATTNNYTEFTAANINATNTRTFVIANQGNENLVITSATVKDITYTTLSSNQLVEGSYTVTDTDSAKFTVTGGSFPITVTPGSTQNITITFAAADMGYQFAQVSFATNAPDTFNPYTFVVKGNGLTPDIEITGNGQAIPTGSTGTSSANNTFIGTANVATSGTVSKTFTISNTGNASLTLSTPTKTGTDSAQFSASLASTTVAAGGSTTLTVTFAPTSAGFKNAVFSIANNDLLGGENPYTFAVKGFGTSYTECATGGGSAIIKSQDFEGSSTWSAQILQNGGGTTTGYTVSSTSLNGEVSGTTVAAIGTKALHSSSTNDNAFYTFSAVNLTNYPGAKLSFRLGAYSNGIGNGLEDGDYILVQVGTTSMTGNANFSTKIRINGGSSSSSQNKWSFTSGTKTVQASYNNTSATVFTPQGSGYLTDEGITTVILTDLPAVSTFYLRILAINSAGNEVWVIDDVKIYTDLPELTNTYANGAWSGVYLNDGAAPTADHLQKVVIQSDYTVTNGATLSACELEVKEGATLTVGSDSGAIGNLDIQGTITNNGSIIINNNSGLIQHNDSATNTGSGLATVTRYSNPLYRLDYTMWGSPVTGSQTLTQFSPYTATYPSRFYTYGYNATQEIYLTITSPSTTGFTPGTGYLIRMPNNLPDIAGYNTGGTTLSVRGDFYGTPNNGNVNVDIKNNTTGIDFSNHYIGISNPYASPINIQAFLTANSDVIETGSAIYFWRKKNDATNTTSSYAYINATGFNFNNATSNINGEFYQSANASSWMISPGQGFLVKLKPNLTTADKVKFTNGMRVAAQSSQPFFKTQNNNDTPAESRWWINLSNTTGAFSQALVGYLPQATLDVDFGYDGRAFNDTSTRLYSIQAEDKFGIQARPSFNSADVVPMGFSVATAGQYTLKLESVDGVFAQDQDIYLKDNVLGTVTNISENTTYTFITDGGTFDSRFEVLYTPQGELGTNNPELENVVMVYQSNGAINITTGNVEMTGVTLYDVRGRKLYEQNGINATQTAINNLNAAQQVIIVEVTTLNGKVSKKIVY
jgi:Abnormal spindle-like microcephaly-assoc'd, ASPM-SPD-2-Hydin